MVDATAPPHDDDAARPAAAGPEAAAGPGEAYDNGFVWTFRGYRLRAAEFTTAMSHFFRAEVQRSNMWRQRLDATTNWAVITTGAAISFAFAGSRSTDHGVLILNTLLVTIFLGIEARRYRYYELWASRVRLMETDFFASMLVPPYSPAPDWAETLAESLLNPQLPISSLEAFGRRLRRNYIWIYLLLAVAWLMKLWLHPGPSTDPRVLLDRAAIGTVPGTVVLVAGIVFNVGLLLVAILTVGLREASGEVLPRYAALEWFSGRGAAATGASGSLNAWFRPSRRRKQLLTLIITDRGAAVGQRLLKELNRGVTELSGTGMYTGQGHSVLLCAVTVSEVKRLEELVRSEDPRAFVIVTPVQEIRGSGFTPLDEPVPERGPL